LDQVTVNITERPELVTILVNEVLGKDGLPGGNGILLPDATDASFTMTLNAQIHIPRGVLTQARQITIPAGVDGNFMEIYNNEIVYPWNLIGTPVYFSDESVVSQLDGNYNYLIKKISGKWRILN
jgi:hypothetical protein